MPIDTEAVHPEDVAQARQWAQEHALDAIVSTDGDADRPLIGDEQGHCLRGDVVGILCAQYLQAQVVVTPVSSNTAVEKCGSFTEVVGYEANGGFLLGSDVVRNGRRLAALPTRDAVLPMLALLCAQALAPQPGGVRGTDQTDGLRVRFQSGDIVHLRPSGNAPELRCYAEADSPERAKLLCDACLPRVLERSGERYA